MTRKFGVNVQPAARRAVAWYSPKVLLQAARELLSSIDFQRNFDRREMFFGSVNVIDLSAQPANPQHPFWFDFISDSGDSGNATYAVARAALAPHLHAIDGETSIALPSGQLLVLGGDIAYPGASPEEYQYRFIEPYEMAKRQAGLDYSKKTVAAIPQNHDWFDSLSTFCRYFVNRSGDFIGASTPQQQTYFAVKLPGNWWILGFDFALGGDIDRNQFEAFCALLGKQPALPDPAKQDIKVAATENTPRIEADAQLILVYPEPYWYRELGDSAREGYPKRYQRLEHQLEANSARIALRIAGDQHHYARNTLAHDPHSRRASHLITCGTGGAFMHPTHCCDANDDKVLDRASDKTTLDPELGERIRVGRCKNPHRQTAHFDATRVRYPDVKTSRGLALGNIFAMFKPSFSHPRPSPLSTDFYAQLWDSNVGFALCLGLLYGFNAYANSLVFSPSFVPDQFGPMLKFSFCEAVLKWFHAMVYTPLALVINVLMLFGCLRIALEGPTSLCSKLCGGILHGLAHAFCVFVLYWSATHWHCLAELNARHPFIGGVGIWLFVALGGILAGGLLFGIYFAVAGWLGQMPNNAFGSLAIQGYKGFMRFKLSDGQLQAHFLALDRVDTQTTWDTPPSGWRVQDKFDV
jgi:hypothetical protein